jgi:DNA repair protein SbcC/Rad50
MMILNSLIIDNIRSYDHEEVVFPRGISLFEGDIGSGKSTILMAIEFALFGLGSQKAESLLAKKAETGYAVLEFTAEDKKYEIRRTLKRKNSGVNQDPKESWIKIQDEKEILSPSELKQRVLQILKFNEPADPKAESKIFRYTIFTPQEAMKEVLSDSKKRLETIRKAFGIEDYSIAQSNAKEVLAKIKTKSAVIAERFSDITQLESEIVESQKIITSLEVEISQNQKQQGILQDDEKNKLQELKQLQEKSNEKTKLELKKENLEERIASDKKRVATIENEFVEFETELKEKAVKLEKLMAIENPDTDKSIPEIEVEIKKVQEINDEFIKLESEKNSITSDITGLKEKFGEKIESNVSSINTALKDLEIEKESLVKFEDEITEKLDKVKQSQTQKQTLKESIQKEIKKFSTLGNACPTCKQEITDSHHHSLVDEKQKEVDELSKELESITDSFFESNKKSKEINEKLESYEHEIGEISKILPGIEEFNSKSYKMNQINLKITELEKQDRNSEYGENPLVLLTAIKDDLVRFEGVTEQMVQIAEAKQKIEKKSGNYQREIDLIDTQNTQRLSELDEIQKELESIKVSGDISDKENQLDSVRKEILQISSVIAATSENLKNQNEKIKQNKSKVIESKKWETKYKRFDQFGQWFEKFFIPAVSQIEKQVLLSILQNFNETYTRWYSILVEDPTKESRIDENFTPIINQDGYDQEIGYLSGGEKTSIALAYRLTLNSLMRKETESMKSNLLILDEPTDGFSKNQLGKIRELLDELKSEQIVLVSHEKELETYVDNIFQVSKENGLSEIVKMN